MEEFQNGKEILRVLASDNFFFLFGQAYYLMQSEETRAAGEALGFGSAALFAAVFGELNL